MKRKFLWVILIMTTSFLVSCASIMNGSKQKISINSNVPGAIILVDGVQVGVTPFMGEIPRKSSSVLIVRKEGYTDFMQHLPTKISGWFWGNIITGGLPGSLTDLASGSMYEYEPNTYFVTLVEAKK